jgi:hypothetical protein
MPGTYVIRNRKLREPCYESLLEQFPSGREDRLMMPRGDANLGQIEMQRRPTCGTIDGSGTYQGIYKGIWTRGAQMGRAAKGRLGVTLAVVLLRSAFGSTVVALEKCYSLTVLSKLHSYTGRRPTSRKVDWHPARDLCRMRTKGVFNLTKEKGSKAPISAYTQPEKPLGNVERHASEQPT